MLAVFKKFKARNWASVIGIFLLTVVQVFFTMQIVTYIGLLTAALPNKDTDTVWWYGIYMVLSAILLTAAQIVIQFLASRTASDVATRIRREIYEKVNSYAISDLASFSTESLITRTTNDVQNVHLALLTGLRTFFVAPITMVWSIIAIIQACSQLEDQTLTVVTALWMFALVAVVIVLIILLMPKYKVVQKLTDQLNIASRENLTGVRVVRAFNAERYQEDKFDKVNQEFTRAQIFTGKVISLFSPVVTFVMMGMTLSILWITSYFMNGQSVEAARGMFGGANSLVMLSSQVVMAFVLLITLVVLLPRANVCMRRIGEILKHTAAINDPETPPSLPRKARSNSEMSAMPIPVPIRKRSPALISR